MTTYEREPADTVEALLPWYLNGTLSRADAARVEAWLMADAEHRARLEDWRNIAAGLTRETPQPLGLAADAQGFERLLARIANASPASNSPPPATHPGQLGSGTRLNDARWRWRQQLRVPMTQATVAMSLCLALIYGWQEATSTLPAFAHTLTSPTQAKSGQLRVILAAELGPAEALSLLNALGARIVQGPNENAVYTLEAGADAAGAARLLETLRADRRVRFAELIPGSSP